MRPGLAAGAAGALVAALAAGCGDGGPAGTSPPAGGEEAGHRRMVETLAALPAEAGPFSDPSRLEELRAAVRELPREASDRERLRLLVGLAGEELRLGKPASAVEAFAEARRIAGELGGPSGRRTLDRIDYWMGVAYLRLGEVENCQRTDSPERCIFPLRGGGVHRVRRGAEGAAGAFRRLLERRTAAWEERVAARWLLAVSQMALGSWPPPADDPYGVPAETFAAEAPFDPFVDRASELGLDTPSLAGGAVVDDLDGDGQLDVAVSSWSPRAPLRVFFRQPSGGFREAGPEAGLAGITGGLNLLHADADGDGDLDLLVLRGGWLREAGRMPNSLLANDGRGRFTDVTFAAGLGEVHRPTQTAAFADFDRDGDLDLYVGNEAIPGDEHPGELFVNRGDGTFAERAAAAGVENLAYAKGVAWGDYDDDGWPDLYVSNYGSSNRLYRNLGDGTFRDVAAVLGVTEPLHSFPVWFWDFDNDGALDLWVGGYPAGGSPQRLYASAASYLGLEEGGERARLYRGDGRGGFTEVGRELGLGRVTLPMGAGHGDLDNDGFPEIYLGTGYPGYDGLLPNVLYRNLAGGGFADVTAAARVGHLQKGHGVAFADLDGDGGLEIFEQMGGFFPADTARDVLFAARRAPVPAGGRWLRIRLRGAAGNRFAVGARLEVEVAAGERRWSVHQVVSTGGSFGAGPHARHVGLGDAERVVAVEVRWPSGGTTRVTGVRPDRCIEIAEGDEGFAEVPCPGLPLPGALAARGASRSAPRAGLFRQLGVARSSK